MKKLSVFILLAFLFTSAAVWADEVITVRELKRMNIIANSPVKRSELETAKKIILNIHAKTEEGVKNGKGPFYAEIYDKNGNLVAASSNSVVEDNCSIYHAEIDTLIKAHKKFNEYNLAPMDLTIYINAEPCIMCMGAIMWSGVKTIYYSVPSKEVERITGFDEGYKPDWIKEFKKRGINVYGNIESEAGEKVMIDYVNSGKEIYKPTR